MPGSDVRQFSYVGLDSRDFPLRHGPSADDLPLPVLGDRIAAQLEVLHNQTHRPVDVMAESEGTLGVYAMLSRHPGLPIGSVVLLSPIVDPGQVSYPSGPDAASVSEEALNELNHLAGEISPYGPSGAQHLLSSVVSSPLTVFLVALAARLWVLFQLLPNNAWRYFYAYNEPSRIAWALVSGFGYSSPWPNTPLMPTAQQPPLYPLLLAVIFRLAVTVTCHFG